MMTNTRQRIILLSITILLNLIISSIATTTTKWWTKQTTTHSKTIIAYYASWQWYDRDGLAAPKNLDHSKVTRYNFAFFQINTRGDIWGTGKQIREWLYVKDGANALVKCLNLPSGNYLFNIGESKGISILDLANLIKDTIGWDGEFNFDTTKPEGVLEKKVDGSIGMKIINWEPNYSLKDGVKETIDWYVENYE